MAKLFASGRIVTLAYGLSTATVCTEPSLSLSPDALLGSVSFT